MTLKIAKLAIYRIAEACGCSKSTTGSCGISYRQG